jgi:hypothetical protein
MLDCPWPFIHSQFRLGHKMIFYISESAKRLCHFIAPNANGLVPLRIAAAIVRRPLCGGLKRPEERQQPLNSELLPKRA